MPERFFDIVNGFFNRRGDARSVLEVGDAPMEGIGCFVLLTDVVNIWLRLLSASVNRTGFMQACY